MGEKQVMVVAGRVLREPFTARAWRTFGYCFCQPFVDLFGFIVVGLVVVASTLTAGVLALPLLPPTLAFARWLGSVHRGMAANMLDTHIPAPLRAARRPGFVGFVAHYFLEPVAWRAVVYLVVKQILLIEFVVGVAFRLLLPLELIGVLADEFNRGQIPLLLVITALFFASPKLTELLLLLDLTLMRRLLGPSEESLRISELEQTRSNAINEAAATLRKIERDLHDGAQARLVALGMRLGRAERQFERGNADGGMALLRESRSETKEIIQELRDLVRGIHPPALDGGLEPALTTLAAMTPVPTSVRVLLPGRLPAATETLLYFTAAELLTNAAKHSGARSAAVTLLAEQHAGVQLIVTDDGRGGATLAGEGSGLRGLEERVRAMDGRLAVDSPPGGPTTVTLQVPPGARTRAEEGN
ncbi:MAG TPA: sensor domain-containing protein [Actinospica sp.]|nr:sensor domain-containing protein [Actinospica sp.]